MKTVVQELEALLKTKHRKAASRVLRAYKNLRATANTHGKNSRLFHRAMFWAAGGDQEKLGIALRHAGGGKYPPQV